MPYKLKLYLGICCTVLATCILPPPCAAQSQNSVPAAEAGFYAIASQRMPPYPVVQLGPFRSLAACQQAIQAAKKAQLINGDAVCVPDRTQ